MDDETLTAWKVFAADSFIPRALVVGVLGNLINFVILSRQCIKSSTNIYLSILAFADTSFLVFIYVSSIQYHQEVHRQKYEIYWRMFGISQWFYTAFLYISVYLTLSLTFDQFDAVRHPARTKCGIIRAKNVVSMVLLFGFLLSISTAFEIQLKSDFTSDKSCKSNGSQVVENATKMSFQPGDNEKPLNSLKRNDSGYNFNEDKMMLQHRLERSLDNDVLSNATDKDDSSKLHHKASYNPADVDHYVNDFERDNVTSTAIPTKNHDTCTQFNLHPVDSSFAKNKIYRAIFKSIGLLLLIVPLVSMMVMCCWMSVFLYQAQKRLQLPVIAEGAKKTSSDILRFRENKITLLVITLLVIFLICHTPNAVYSLYKSWLNNSQILPEATNKIKNVILAFEISCQILMSINCCSKIFMYLLVYDEYWTSLKSLKNCFHCSSNVPREQIINTSKHLFPSTKADVESLLNYSLNQKRYATQIPPEARHYRTAVATPRTHKPSNSSSTPNASIISRLSLTPSTEGIEMGVREMNRISTQLQVERQSSMRSNMSFRALHLSPSQASLARSKSLNIQSTMKHSPNCRLNKKL